MNTYEVKSDIRRKVTICIAVLSLILGNALFTFSNFLASLIAEEYPLISDFLDQWAYLGIISSQITVVTVYELITWLFENYLWKISYINNFLGIPNLNGIWEGGLQSSYPENCAGKKMYMRLEIEQTWNKISCTSIFPNSKSFSDIVCVDSKGPQGTMLKFTYTNYSEDISLGLIQFAGYNELRLDDANTLSGTYYTKRIPSTRGTMLLVRRIPESDINEPINVR